MGYTADEAQLLQPEEGGEPVLAVGGITAFVSAALVLLAIFVPLPAGLDVAVLGVVAAGAPLVAAIVARGKVTANANVVTRATHSGFIVAGAANPSTPAGARVGSVSEEII